MFSWESLPKPSFATGLVGGWSTRFNLLSGPGLWAVDCSNSHWGKCSREDKEWEDTNTTETKGVWKMFFLRKRVWYLQQRKWLICRFLFNDCTSPLFACFSLGFLVNPWPETTVSPKILLRNIDSSSSRTCKLRPNGRLYGGFGSSSNMQKKMRLLWLSWFLQDKVSYSANG